MAENLSAEQIATKNGRKAKRRMLTMYAKKLEDAMKNDDIESSEITALFSVYENIHKDVLSLNEKLSTAFTDFDDNLKNEESVQRYLLLFHQIRVRIENRERLLKTNPVDINMSESSVKTNSRNDRINVHLPKLSLPKFSGNILEWQPFWQLFEATIHNNTLSDVEKFSYLLSHLEGPAKMVISGLPITSENYNVALRLLIERYGVSKNATRNHLQNLLSLPEVQNSSVDQLNQFIMRIESNMRGLESLGVYDNQYDKMLFEIIASKLPQDLSLSYARSKYFAENNSKAILDFLKSEVQVYQFTSTRSMDNRETPVRRQPHFSFQHKNQFSMQPLNSTIMNSTQGKTEHTCPLCNAKHKLVECNQFLRMDISNRRNVVQKNNICFNCLLAGHTVMECKNQFRCKICNGKHHTLIHQPTNGPRNPYYQKSYCNSSMQNASTTPSRANSKVSLATASITMQNKDARPCRIKILLDTGSEETYIREEALKKIPSLKIGDRTMSVFGFGETTDGPKNFEQHQIRMPSSKGEITLTAFSVQKLCITPSNVEWQDWPHLQNIREQCADLGTDNDSPVDLVIGADNMDVILGTQIRKGCPMAIETVFGWVLLGRSGSAHQNDHISSAVLAKNRPPEEELIKRVFEAEPKLEKPVASSFSLLQNRVNRDESGRYEIQIPWTKPIYCLHDLYKRSFQRMCILTTKLDKNPELLAAYQSTFEDYLKKGYIEKTKFFNQGPQRFIPHHPVIKPYAEKTKTRIVFDASAVDSDGVSQNSLMPEGPNLNPDILHLLLRFRFFKHGITADVEQAFLQIKISELDKNMCKFLWLKDDSSDSKYPFEIYRFCRLPFGLRSSPYILAATIRIHFKNYIDNNPNLAKLLDKSMYVDDLVTGANCELEALSLKNEIISLFGDMQMNMRKWTSNLPQINDEDCASEETSVLGVRWNKQQDKLGIKGNFKTESGSKFTRRTFLQLAAQVFDPVGLLSPFTLKAKLILRNSWASQKCWDDEFEDELNDQANKWKDQCDKINEISVPRNVGNNLNALYVFCDASEVAYAACVYAETADNDVLHLLMSKSKIASGWSVPRLELQAALLGTKCMEQICHCVDLKGIDLFYITDSMIVYGWINSRKQIKDQFVNRRITKIRSTTKALQWKHVSGALNPADIPSRGADVSSLLANDKWWHGLPKDEIHALTKDSSSKIVALPSVSNSERVIHPVPILQFNRFSQLQRLFRSMSWVLRFVGNCRTQEPTTGDLSAEEIAAARIECIKQSQLESFADDIQIIKQGSPVPKMSRIFQLNPFLDEHGVLRSNRRLESAEQLTMDEKFPVLLDCYSHFTKLLIHDLHRRTLHSNLSVLLTELRNHYAIIRCRQTVRKAINECPQCRWKKLLAHQNNFAPLPKCRVSLESWSNVFENIGLDHFGPLYSSDQNKTYCVIFTCLSVRALHLELVASLSADDFMKAFERFKARRGCPAYVISDNSKTFKHASSVISSRYGCSWKFIVERAPWQGGVYERLIQSVKQSIKSVLRGKIISTDQLTTLLCTIEGVINSRPITYLSLSLSDPEPLTPAHFLIGRSLVTNAPHMTGRPKAYQGKELRELYQGKCGIMVSYLERWKKEFLRNLRLTAREERGEFQKGDVVLINNEKQPHTFPFGIIEECFVSRDRKCRSVLVNTGKTTIRRPIEKIFLFERCPGSVTNS